MNEIHQKCIEVQVRTFKLVTIKSKCIFKFQTRQFYVFQEDVASVHYYNEMPLETQYDETRVTGLYFQAAPEYVYGNFESSWENKIFLEETSYVVRQSILCTKLVTKRGLRRQGSLPLLL